jgi:DNA polymerase III subunit epsilon
MLRKNGIEELIERVQQDGDYRVLRRLKLPEGPTGLGMDNSKTSVGLVVDVETTGTNTASDQIIELALRRFRYDADGDIVKIDRAWSWREDPGRPLDPEITAITGLTDADLVGQSINEDAAIKVFQSAGLVIAHSAGFDRKFVERRLPEVAGLSWACTCAEPDWRRFGFDGRALGWLGMQAGWFYDAHRAEADVDAVIALLMHRAPDGTTVLADLLDSARCASVLVEAIGADFGVKDSLRERGYRWNADAKVWGREIEASDLMSEEFWLSHNVYAFEHRPRAMGPRLTALTAKERYA